jgi:hypothetical protein
VETFDMADDSEVQIRFTASTDAVEEGIANVHKALSGLAQSMSDVSGAAAGLRGAFTAALPTDKLADASKALSGVGDQTARTTGQIKEMGNAIRLANAGFNSTRQQLATELKLHEITYDQETTQLLAALDKRLSAQTEALTKEYNAEVSSQAGKLDAQAAAYQKYIAGLAKIDATWAGEHQKVIDNALIHDQQAWQSALSPVLNAWNSQLRGLLGGTESWSKAMKKIVGDLVIQIIEYFERLAVQKAALGLADMFKGTALGGGPQSFVQSLFGAGTAGAGNGAAQGANTAALTANTASVNAHAVASGANTAATSADTTATTAGATATTAGATATTTGTVATTANTAGLLSHLGALAANTLAIVPNTLATILNTAAEDIKSLIPLAQGAWEVPATMPALVHAGEMIVPAEGGHAEALRALLGGFSAPKFDLGTDMVLRGGLAIVHPGESILPAARGSGPFTGAGMAANTTHINPSINITAMDSRSVARFFNDNAHHMVRALQRGLKSGAHLPLRSAMR